MQIRGFISFLLLMSLSWINANSDPLLPVRLGGGNSTRQGRIELFHNNSWGTVCDDRVTIHVCRVICKQLFESIDVVCINEQGNDGCMHNDGSVYGPANGRIWIDSLVCDGSEQSLDACRKSNWGDTNCGHKEDAGCVCRQNRPNASSGCDAARHRIVPFDANHPNIGRVEVQDENNNWGLVCDDDWDRIDAHVFCDCLGYRGSHQFLALLTLNHSSDLPMLYDSVHCKANDTVTTKNLWDCKVTKATGRECDPKTEAAAVMCGPRPAWLPPEIPDVTMSCDGQNMSGCLLSDSTDLSLDQFSFSPNCSNAFIYQNDTRDICFSINMGECQPSLNKEFQMQSNDSVTHYCYDLVYSKTNQDFGQPHKGHMWSLPLCCIVRTNATSVGSFLPQVPAPPPIYAHNSRDHTSSFDMRCYLGDLPTSGKDLTFPAIVRVGEPVSCMVSANNSWDRHLTLVASNCKFMTSSNGTGIESYFIRNKCTTAEYNDLLIENRDQLHWGFKFGVPKFSGYSELYVSCDVYLCHATKQAKPYCDRSCVPDRGIRVQRRAGRRDTGKSEEKKDDDETVGLVKRGPFIFYGDRSQFPFANPEDQYVPADESEDDKKQKLEEYEEFMLSKSSDGSFSWRHVCVYVCVFACLHILIAAVKVVFGE